MNTVIYHHANDLREMTDEEIPTQFVSERRTEKESSRRRIFDVILGAGALRIRWACPLLRAIGLDKFGHRADGAEYLFALCGVFELDAVVLLQEHDQLQGVDGVEAEAAAKELVAGGESSGLTPSRFRTLMISFFNSKINSSIVVYNK